MRDQGEIIMATKRTKKRPPTRYLDMNSVEFHRDLFDIEDKVIAGIKLLKKKRQKEGRKQSQR
ncbi:MAG: hypothetical protein A2156_01090 [Deltaproteobacteria bacterium RBG_16_48_10]|nr:MAG: hypothetical protein A2156_01090 [Deltaproteobacteria bacterium RBG_16_48_10]